MSDQSSFVPELLPRPKARAKEGEVGRRSFIKLLSAVTAGAIAMPNKAEAFSLDEFLQKHFHQMTDDEKQKTLTRLEREYNEKYSREDFTVDASDDCLDPFVVDDEKAATVEITLDASQAAVMDVFGFFNGKTLSAEVSMRKEDDCA